MKLALKEGNSGLVNHLARQLPSDYQTMGDALGQLAKRSGQRRSVCPQRRPTDFTRAATGIAFARLARQDAENARLMIPTLARLQKMSESERTGAGGIGRLASDGQRRQR
ncbi:Soluble lytic murein transglycosylase precursor [Serratia odorifera]|uniref:Soluble lytic murein transglycosylase n=1 Tax=Serratia odorifera TaxID=618 RepID=A0A447KM22_SEROD|nr:Soluble lytic murein transglycosylase precursor [Serratia odorifera]